MSFSTNNSLTGTQHHRHLIAQSSFDLAHFTECEGLNYPTSSHIQLNYLVPFF